MSWTVTYLFLLSALYWAESSSSWTGSSHQHQCHNGWLPYDNACYLFSRESGSWVEAYQYCKIFNSQLLIPQTEHEYNFIKQTLRGMHPNAAEKGTAGYYLSGTDSFVEGEWEFVPTAARINYPDWHTGEPTNGGSPRAAENCVIMYGGYDFQWNDVNCHNPNHFICKTQLVTTAGAVVG